MNFANNLLNLQNKKVVLASSSPRRKELLEIIGLKFSIHSINIEEGKPRDYSSPESFVKAIAKQKMDSIQNTINADLIITADTVVCLESNILCKPRDKEEASEYLKKLSNKTHQVYSGCCLKTKKEEIIFHESTKVTFSKLSSDEIENYIETNEPFDKAGAYGIQGYASVFVEKVNGCFFNVIGFPVNRFYREVQRLKF